MAARFWVGGTGNWDAVTTTHWSTSSGGAGGASVPGASDDVTFDGSSGGGTVTVTASQNILSITHSAHTGTLNFNGQTMTIGTFTSTGSATRTLTLGSSSITITGTGTAWNLNNATNLTLNANTSTITMTGASVTFQGDAKTYNSVVFSGGGSMYCHWGNTFTNLTVTGTSVKTDSFTCTSTNTITGSLTFSGNSSINRLQIKSNTVGSINQYTTTGATVTCSNVDFQDIALSVSKDFSSQTDIGDCGGNSGITFPASVAQYYGGVNMNGSYLRCNGIASNYVSTPDSSALSTTGDITIDIKLSADDWTPTTSAGLVSKYLASGNQRSYYFLLATNGKLQLVTSVDGAATITSTSSVATGLTDGATKWLRVACDVNNGASGNDVKFYMSDDGSAWTQLGTTITNAGATSIFDSTSMFEIGSLGGGSSNNLVGNVYRTIVYSDLTQTNKVFDADFTAQTAGTKSFTESSSNGATVSNTITGGNWSASSWTTRVPLPQDDAYLGNAFSASQTVTADMPRLGRSIDWTGATGSPTFSLSTGTTIYGSLILISSMTSTGTSSPTFSGRGNFYLTSAGLTLPWTFLVKCFGGSLTLNDSFTSTGNNWYHSIGGFYTNGFSMTCGIFNFGTDGNTVRTLDLSNSVMTTTSTAATTVWNMTSATNLTYIASTPTIVISGASANKRTFAGLSQSYGTLTYTVAGSTGELDITGSNSFAQINFSDSSNARSLKFTNGTTTTIRNRNGFNVRGTSGKKMTLDTVDGAGTFTLTSPSRQASCDYITPTRSTVDASPAWYAGANSNDGGTTTNWLFADAPSMNTGNGSGSNGIQSRMNLQNLRSLI